MNAVLNHVAKDTYNVYFKREDDTLGVVKVEGQYLDPVEARDMVELNLTIPAGLHTAPRKLYKGAVLTLIQGGKND